MKTLLINGFATTLILIGTLEISLHQADAMDAVYCTNCGTEWTQLTNKLQLVQQLQTSMQSLQTQINQYKNMVTNTASMPTQLWGNTMNDITKINALIQQSQALAKNASNLDSEFAQRYGTYDSYVTKKMSGNEWTNKYSQWSKETSDNTRYTMKALGMQSNQMDDEESLMEQLQGLSQSAQGRMQAIQVGNMMAAQGIRQTQKLRQLLMLQIQMQADYLATQQDKEAAQQAAVTRFHRDINVSTTNGKRY